MGSVTVVLSGLPTRRPGKLGKLKYLSHYLNEIFRTTEIGIFQLRKINNKIAVDFNDGFDAMYAQDLLDGIPYTLDDNGVNIIRARVTHNPVEMLKEPLQTVGVEHSDYSNSSEDIEEGLEEGCGSMDLDEGSGSMDSKKANTMVKAQLKRKMKVVLTEEQLLVKEKERIQKELCLLGSTEDEENNTKKVKISGTNSGGTLRLPSTLSMSDSDDHQSEHHKKFKTKKGSRSMYYTKPGDRDTYYQMKHPRDHDWDRSSRDQSRSGRDRSRSGWDWSRSGRNWSRPKWDWSRSERDWPWSGRDRSRPRRFLSERDRTGCADKPIEPKTTKEPQLKRATNKRISDTDALEVETKRKEVVKDILLDLETPLNNLSADNDASGVDRTKVLMKMFDKITKRVNLLKVTRDTSVSDLALHYRCKYSKVEDQMKLTEVFSDVIAMQHAAQEIASTSRSDPLSDDLDSILQDLDFDMLTEDINTTTSMEEEVIKENEKKGDVTKIVINIVPRAPPSSITPPTPSTPLTPTTPLTPNTPPPPTLGLTVYEKRKENGDNAKITTSKKERKLKINFKKPIKKLLNKLKPAIIRSEKEYTKYPIEIPFLIYVIKNKLEERLSEVFRGVKHRMKTSDIIIMYRNIYPETKDKAFICDTIHGIWHGLYNDYDTEKESSKVNLHNNIVEQDTSNIVKQEIPDIVKKQTSSIVKRETADIVKQQTSSIVKRETADIVKQQTSSIVKRETADIVKQQTSSIVKRETADIVKQQTFIVKRETPDIVKQEITEIGQEKIIIQKEA